MKKWGGLLILIFLFIGSWVGQFFSQLAQVRQDNLEHGQPFEWSSFWPEFWAATFENWQSEFLQLGVQALLVGIFASVLFTAYERAQKQTVRAALDEWWSDKLREEWQQKGKRDE